MGNAWSPPPNCLQIELRGGGKQCDCGPLRVEEYTVANDQRVLARVSGEEAREYIRGVNAHVAKGTGKYRWPICGCFACFLLGAALFGVMMGVFHEEKRLRCEARLCSRGEDPLLLPHGKPCCVFWCCGEGMDGGKHHHELPARPYNTSWDVWSSEAYFGIDERCSLYHDGDEHRPEDHTPRDANYGCGSCPARLSDEGECKTMFEGPAKDYEVTWPLLFLIPYLLPIPFIIFFICASACAVPRLYEEAFEDWRARGVVTHVTYQRGGKHSPNYLRLWFPPGQSVQPVITGPVVTGQNTFLVQVPPGSHAGQMMQVTSPAGVPMQVQIPAGMYPGATFAVASPAAPAVGVVEGVSYAEEEAGEPVLQAKVVPEREW
ncbi:unnamed protein product [Pelagomonas calceolata]|uniref:Transmembrane protein n=1 Tax=Pelagomonas calceolata TaxID=35677 RepID=A0A7S3ZSX9_9STRA|nr:unnamed protein product [Pelagomonas calceolata]